VPKPSHASSPDTIAQRIVAGAARGHDVTFISGDVHTTVPWTDVHRDATAMAAALQGRGIRPGDHVALLGPTTRALVTGIQAVWLAGGTVVVLPLPMRMGSLDEFVTQTRHRIHRADIALVVADPDLAAFVSPEPADPPMVCFADLVPDAAFVPPIPDP
jgi:fatty-acyl-CoA synthase